MPDPVLQRIDRDFDAAVDRWSDFLRIPSVSTDPACGGDMERAAQWLVDTLKEIGFDGGIRPTDGHPAVLMHHPGPGGDAPHLLYYGHYDVQPPDPLEEWDADPFEPTIVDGPHGRRMVARGAVDDKGQLMMWLEALRAWHAEHGGLPARVTVLVEGEEEIGSRNLRAFLERHRDELGADVCIVSDTTMWDVDTPAITYTLRGLLYTEITCRGPSRDLHSGFYGGAVTNPVNALAHLLAGLQDGDGRVRVSGFYDDVVEPSAEELAAWRGLEFDEAGFLATAGVEESGGGEHDRSLLERLWSRPTCDVNGILGGFTGIGAKTVIPTHASAKLSFRLVPNQDPAALADALRRHVEANTPSGCRCQVEVHSAAPAFRVPPDSPWLRAARDAMTSVYGREAVPIGCGGSIPVAAWMREILGIDTLLMGFSLEDDGMHSPNEKFELVCFERGMKSHVALLDRVSRGDV
jgi:acetylornithine deacetylase/succinyl-diaminopimelate desuccinylase-like protein